MITDAVQDTRHKSPLPAIIYGTVSLAVVISAWDGDARSWDLVLLIVGYMVTLWLAHAYSVVVGGGAAVSWPDALREEAPIMLAGVPPLAIAVVGTLAGWSDETTAELDLIACAGTLVLVQTLTLLAVHAPRRRIVGTVMVDLLIAALIVGLFVRVHH